MEKYCVHGYKDSILGCHCFSNWSVIPAGLFWVKVNNLFLKFIWKCKESRISEAILKKNKVKAPHDLTSILDIKLHDQGSVVLA